MLIMDTGKHILRFTMFFTLILSLCGCNADELNFTHSVIDRNIGGRTAIGDIDGDGYNDIVVHTWSGNRGVDNDGRISWYKYPNWQRYSILNKGHIFGDGVLIVDLDADGYNDVVTAKGNDGEAHVFWYENPWGSAASVWKEHKIGTVELGSEVKDVEVHDMDHDGKLDVIVRTKHTFAVYYQINPFSWMEKKVENAEREGMNIGDLDGDGDYDVLMNGFWLENPEHPRTDPWKRHDIDAMWYEDVTGGWQDHSVMADIKDINGDGKNDVVLSHSEKTGFSIMWYASVNPKAGKDGWERHKVGVIDYCHTLRADDMDLDGDIDIVAGTLIRTSTPEICIFLNQGKGQSWDKKVVATESAYKAKTGDIDNDGDIDIVTAKSWDKAPVQLWRNTLK
jgi:hypothetical protein